jgi:hypothetical protein
MCFQMAVVVFNSVQYSSSLQFNFSCSFVDCGFEVGSIPTDQAHGLCVLWHLTWRTPSPLESMLVSYNRSCKVEYNIYFFMSKESFLGLEIP